MTKFLISFPAPAMEVSPEELPDVSNAAFTVVTEAMDAGVFVFGGGLNEEVPPVMVTAEGTVTEETYPQSRELSGGFTVLELESRDEAMLWAAKFAAACRCPQEVREFGYDPRV